MKKLLLCMLVLIMTLALVACGGTGDESDIPSDDDHVHVFEEAIEVEPTCVATGKKVMKCACGEIESEEELPMGMHDATSATCTEDAVCKTCGTVLAEKFGHFFGSDAIVKEATCVAEGVKSGVCQNCGESVDELLPIDPDNHNTDVSFADDGIASTCKDCGQSANFAEGTVIADLDFENIDDFANYPDMIFKEHNAVEFSDGVLKSKGSYVVDYNPEAILATRKLFLSFDFQLTKPGKPDMGESILTFRYVNPSDGKNKYNWLIKYYEANKALGTADSVDNVTAENSITAEIGKWYKVTAMIDVAALEVQVYIDGVYVGTRPFTDHTMDTKFGVRFGGALTSQYSEPIFDNFKLVEIK